MYKIKYKCKYEPHTQKRPSLTKTAKTKEEMIRIISSQTNAMLDEYNIIISSGYWCKSCGIEIPKSIYNENQLCNACDDAIKNFKIYF